LKKIHSRKSRGRKSANLKGHRVKEETQFSGQDGFAKGWKRAQGVKKSSPERGGIGTTQGQKATGGGKAPRVKCSLGNTVALQGKGYLARCGRVRGSWRDSTWIKSHLGLTLLAGVVRQSGKKKGRRLPQAKSTNALKEKTQAEKLETSLLAVAIMRNERHVNVTVGSK